MNAPIIGAALTVPELPDYRDWLFDHDRDLELQSFWDPALLISGDWGALVDEARDTLDGFRGRLGIHGPFWGLSFSNPDPEIRTVIARRMLTGLEICEALGATQMVIHSPYTTWDHHNLDLRAEARGAVLEAAADCLGPAVARARDAGVELVLENIEDIAPADRRLLADHLGADVVGLSIDTGHAHYAHGATGAPPVDFFVRDAGTRLSHVHLQDADGYADRHWEIGKGTIRWHAVFAALADCAEAPRLILELSDKRGILPSMAWLAAEGLGR